MKIGAGELLLVFIVALIIIGPDKLPMYMKKFGEAIAQFKKASDDATGEIKKNVVEPLEEAQKPLREAIEPVNELNTSVKKNLNTVQNSINNIGKVPPVKKTGAAKPAVAVVSAPQPDADELAMEALEEAAAGAAAGADA